MRYLTIGAAAAMLALSLEPALAQAEGAAKPVSMQAAFNAAVEAWQRDDCAAALPMFAQLASDPRIKPGSLPAAAIAVRRGDCLIRTDKFDEGERSVNAGLTVLRTAGAEFLGDVANAEVQLARLAVQRFDRAAAMAHLEAALALSKGNERQLPLLLLARLTAFDGDGRGLAAADEGLKLEEAAPKPNKQALANWHAAHARILLNQGANKEGYAELKAALRLMSAGTPNTISISEAALLADLAQAALLNRDKNQAYTYMAMSGAGRIEGSPFSSGGVPIVFSPTCGPDTGLEPKDVAVVEFVIGDDGSIPSAQTVYTTGGFAKATAFAKAVREWSWKPETVAKLPNFFRRAMRIELRCANAEGGGGISPLSPLIERFDAWAGPHLDKYVSATGSVTGTQKLITAAQAAQQQGDPAGELAVRTLLARKDVRTRIDVIASIDRALSLIASPGIPPEAQAAARVILTATRPDLANRLKSRSQSDSATDAELLALANEPDIARDALAQDTALLRGVPLKLTGADTINAAALVLRVAEDSRLSEHHPLRQLAQLRLANEAARGGDLASAQAWFAKTGLNQEQCALIGPKPALNRINTGASAYPVEALYLGFEGWVNTEFDIQADGRTAEVRAVIAYPPFVFADAAASMLKNARYQASYRPENGAACSANLESINFIQPKNDNTAKVIKKKPS